jgi:hypothetical protein
MFSRDIFSATTRPPAAGTRARIASSRPSAAVGVEIDDRRLLAGDAVALHDAAADAGFGVGKDRHLRAEVLAAHADVEDPLVKTHGAFEVGGGQFEPGNGRRSHGGGGAHGMLLQR